MKQSMLIMLFSILANILCLNCFANAQGVHQITDPNNSHYNIEFIKNVELVNVEVDLSNRDTIFLTIKYDDNNSEKIEEPQFKLVPVACIESKSKCYALLIRLDYTPSGEHVKRLNTNQI
jgi:hypothetical protein